MFEGEEYASYLQLCQGLDLDHVVGEGDYFITEHPAGLIPRIFDERLVLTRDSWWAPRLDQWLTMLEEAGLPDVFFVPRWAVGQFQVWREGQKTMTGPCGEGPTREEAAARLFLSVTGRTVTSG